MSAHAHIHTYPQLSYAVDGETFAGLNICSFSVIKVSKEILLCCLGHKCQLFSTIKERHLNSRKNSHGTLHCKSVTIVMTMWSFNNVKSKQRSEWMN